MKSPAKVLLGVFSTLLLLALLAWTGTFLYWHIRITRAVRVLETTNVPETGGTPRVHQDAALTLMNAGCRCLPYLVRALDPAGDPEFLSTATFIISWESVLPGIPLAECSSEELGARMGEWDIILQDPPETKRRKCELIQSWWKEHGTDHHQWWRVWTGECRPYTPPR